MYQIQTTVPATAEPFSLAQMAGWLRADPDLEGDRIQAAMAASRQFLEAVTGQRFAPQTVKIWLLGFPRPCWTLPVGPVTSIVSIKYFTIADAEATVPNSLYYVVSDEDPPYITRIVLKDGASWPSVNLRPVKAVEITAQVGHAITAIPGQLAIAYRQLVAHYFSNPSATAVIDRAQASTVEIPYGAMALLQNFRLA